MSLFCKHKYKILKVVRIFYISEDKPRYLKLILQCENCGKIKIIKIK